MKKPLIRFAQPADMPSIILMCAAHAEYEQSAYDEKDKERLLAKDLFSNNPKLYCLVVEGEHELLGYATYMRQYSTWDARDYVYMDCLFVVESARGFGLGEQLVDRIKQECRKNNCQLIQWQTPSFNTRAMKFYERIGAYSKNKERYFLEVPV